MDVKKQRQLSSMILGNEKAPLVFKNATIINVFTNERLQGDMAVAQDTIIGIGCFEGEVEVDCEGKYICPGFIDSHLHLESTLVTPGELIHVAALSGTTTFIVDPHESANVAGLEGVQYILEQTEGVAANVYVMAPSCVPATAADDNGYSLDADALELLLNQPRILGLGEVMDYESVIEGDGGMFEKLALFEDRVKDGHAPFLSDRHLMAYALAGINTDHECCDYEYAMKERRNGMTVLIRQGSAAKNLDAIVSGMIAHGTETTGFCFCTDDKHIEDIEIEGHISWNVRRSIELGMDPVKAVGMASYNAARTYGLKNIGALAPGYQADFLILSDLNKIEIDAVYFKGQRITDFKVSQPPPCPRQLMQTVHLDGFDGARLMMRRSSEPVPVIGMMEGQIFTKHETAVLPGGEWFVPDETYKKIAVIERHKGTGRIGLGAVTGFGIRNGAIASSVSHDSHNLIVIGDNDGDMQLAVETIIANQGGYVLVERGRVVGNLPLPIMGLMSDAGHRTVHRVLKDMIKKAREMGISQALEPFITLSFMALPVIPQLRLTARGMYDVEMRRFV